MEQEVEATPSPSSRIRIKSFLRCAFIIVLACSIGWLYRCHVRNLFEKDRHFSHLSELEREMSLRTEMGFYYSYYKTVVETPQYFPAITKLMYDGVVEYPTEVNALNRFNIYPEVLVGTLYRYLLPLINSSRECHTVDRGPDLQQVTSCNGLGEPMVFYLEAVWIWAGLTLAAIMLYGTVLSQTILGGIFAVQQYMMNHHNCTRVMWAPNERENMAQPLLLLQMCMVTYVLRMDPKKYKNYLPILVAILFLNLFCLLFWQFSQFIFLTQVAILYFMEQLRIIDLTKFCVLLYCHVCGLHLAVLFLQGNDMLKTSIYTSFFIVVYVQTLLFGSLRLKIKTRRDLLLEALLVIFRTGTIMVSSFALKQMISHLVGVAEDTHVWDILRSKFTYFKNFHTLLYTCSAVFSYMPLKTYLELLYTYIIPFTLYAVASFVNISLAKTDEDMDENEAIYVEPPPYDDDYITDSEDSGIEHGSESKDEDSPDEEIVIDYENEFLNFFSKIEIDPAMFYNILQMSTFGVMAFLVMRLKLLWVPQMCIVASMIMNLKYMPNTQGVVWRPNIFRPLILIGLTALWFYFYQEFVGEFLNIPLEQLLEWIKSSTPTNAVFAGPMPITAAVMLSTRRAIVNHPHYEHAGARNRTYAVYKTYGRFTPNELYEELSKLEVSYLILQKAYCYQRNSRGCRYIDMWDVEKPSLIGQPSLCHRLLTEKLDHFYPMFDNEGYAVFKIHDERIELSTTTPCELFSKMIQ